ncbi:MAG: ATP-binding protein [Bryobacterales bacterium]|nr:ATP-binding protein [Bryobacterales bacterium]
MPADYGAETTRHPWCNPESAVRYFNTEGPIDPEDHYHIAPLSRIDLEQILLLIQRKKYFILHAPRQTGKTSVLLALADHLNAAGRVRCLYVNIEPVQTAHEDVDLAIRTVLSEIVHRAKVMLGDHSGLRLRPQVLAQEPPDSALRVFLARWSESSRRPLVLLLDEIDTLEGDSLISVLRQLRGGYDLRPASAPQCVILCGVRDVRDFRIYPSHEGTHVMGDSAFNIKAESLRLGDFSEHEVRDLLGQHTAETGQMFEEPAIDRIWDLTLGQP